LTCSLLMGLHRVRLGDEGSTEVHTQ